MSYIDIQAEHNRRQKLSTKTNNELRELKEDYINKYIDNENATISCSYRCRIEIHNRIYYVGGLGYSIAKIKPESCDMDTPNTEDEIRERIRINKECKKAAARAYLAYKYITGEK
jgi:hypothetical protein